MNCKPGDLAIVTRSVGPNLGKIVKCIRLLTAQDLEDRKVIVTERYGAKWLVEGANLFGRREWETEFTVKIDWAPDECLRPIRGQLGEDEMVTIVKNKQLEPA
jgi:hypothetical protein